jgi:transcription elongation factor Elf1
VPVDESGFGSRVEAGSEVLKEARHRGAESTSDHLEGYDSDFSFAALDIRDVTTVHIQIHGHIGLGPSLPFSKCLDSFPQLDTQAVIVAGHGPMIGVLSGPVCLVCQTSQMEVFLTDRVQDFNCPKCGSDNTISVPLAHGSGTTKTESLSVYVGTKENYGLIPTFERSQTAVARLLTPPTKKHPRGEFLILGLMLSAFGLLMAAIAGHSDGQLSPLLGILFIIGGIVAAVAGWTITSREAQEYNENTWRPRREEWEKSFLCQRCGTVFIPSDSVSMSTDL